MGDQIRIILAEDSPTVRRYLASIIAEAPDMRVVGEARNGDEAVRMVSELRPDVVSMDVNMPKVDGLAATRIIMEKTPTPIVVVSDLLHTDIELSLRAIEAGALAVIGKPPSRYNPEFEAKRHELLTTLRAMAGVKVISRRRVRTGKQNGVVVPGQITTQSPHPHKLKLIVFGASTGGPSALLQILKTFPDALPVPMVIAQHMPNEFIRGLALWLSSVTPLRVVVAHDGMVLDSGMVIIAPGDQNLTIVRKHGKLVAKLLPVEQQMRYTPSIDVLFESVAANIGKHALGIILTGMGDDGARGLLAIRQAGGYTLVQDEDSAIVYGMPRAATAIGAAHEVVPLTNLAFKIGKML